MKCPTCIGLVLALGCVSAATAQISGFGLIDGTIVFVDGESDARCAAVNTINADFIIRSCDRRLVLLRGTDRTTPFTVDSNYNVVRDDGVPAGIIRFATDRDNNRQVFWLSDDNFPEGQNNILRYNLETDQLSVEVVQGQGENGEPTTIVVAPINVTDTECDPLTSFDGGTDLLCPRACGATGLAPALLMAGSAGWRVCRRRRTA